MQEHPHHIDEYMLEIRRGKALAVIVEAATVTDSNGDVVELARIQPDGSLGDPAGATEVEGTVTESDDDATESSGDRRVRGRDEGLSSSDGERREGPEGNTPRALVIAGLGQILRFSGSSPKDDARLARQDVSYATTARVR